MVEFLIELGLGMYNLEIGLIACVCSLVVVKNTNNSR